MSADPQVAAHAAYNAELIQALEDGLGSIFDDMFEDIVDLVDIDYAYKPHAISHEVVDNSFAVLQDLCIAGFDKIMEEEGELKARTYEGTYAVIRSYLDNTIPLFTWYMDKLTVEGPDPLKYAEEAIGKEDLEALMWDILENPTGYQS